MDKAKIFKDYFVSSQNTVLIPNEDFGKRKFLNVGINRSLSLSRIEEISQNHTVEMRSANKQWIHPPDAISRGHILYLVKFLGECEVEAPKGTDVVKDAIRKRKFNKSLRKTEGQKTPKVELSISIDGVAIQDPKTKIIRHSYPLHRISYCADDKSDKRMFTFIAKAPDSNKHFCYVFASDKNAEEITLTIGQAFDLAYRRFLDSQNKDTGDTSKKQFLLQKKVETLEKENEMLKLRIRELELLKDRSDVENYKRNNKISDLTSDFKVKVTAGIAVEFHHNTGESTTDSPVASQQNSPKQSSVGRRLEYLVLDSDSPAPVTNGNAQSPMTPGMISPPPPSTRSRSGRPVTPGSATAPPIPPRNDTDELASIFNSSSVQQYSSFTNNNHVFDPFASPAASGADSKSADPFGMSSFNPGPDRDTSLSKMDTDTSHSKMDTHTSLSKTDTDFLDLQKKHVSSILQGPVLSNIAGFSQGLSFGTEELHMDSFDSCSQSFD